MSDAIATTKYCRLCKRSGHVVGKDCPSCCSVCGAETDDDGWCKQRCVEPSHPFEGAITIEVSQLEFHQGGDTIWIHGPNGETILRIKTWRGKVTAEQCVSSPFSHADVIVDGDITICIAKKS